MKLVYPDYKNQIIFQEGCTNLWIIENQKEFRRLIHELYAQTQGEDGRFVLSEENDILNVKKTMQCILVPFDLELNNKKILEAIYTKLKNNIMESSLFLSQNEMLGKVFQFLEEIIEQADYPLTYNEDIDIKSIFKLVNLKLDSSAESMPEQLYEYIRLHQQILGIKVFVFVNLRTYLTDEELEDLLRYLEYYKASILLIESQDRGEKFKGEKKYIIDKDLCEIY